MKKLIIVLTVCMIFGKSFSQPTGKTCVVTDDFLSAVLMTPDEKIEKAEWMKKSFNDEIPFSFIYNGRNSSELLKKWQRNDEIIETNPKYSLKRIQFSDKETGLICYADVKEFNDYPAVEWTVYFKNTSKTTTPIIENIEAVSTDIACPYFCGKPENRGQNEIHYSNGSQARMDDFISITDTLDYNATKSYTSITGRSSNDYLPFFNLKNGPEGVITAIGWTGTWKCSFTSRHWRDTVTIKAGMEKTHLKLQPGEDIRTPKILLFFWKGDMDHAHNMFRRFMLNYHTPKQNGKPITMPISCCTWGGMKEKSHLDLIKVIKNQKLDYDCYWIDAGWYGPKHETEEYQHMITNDWFRHAGNWNFNPTVVPNGFKQISDAAHDAGMKLLLWFEPERAVKGTPITLEHPEYFLQHPGDTVKKGIFKGLVNWQLNFGNPDAQKYITDFISEFMTKNGIDIYREDCNFYLAAYWSYNDKPDRIGMTEIKYITGLYKFWDELRSRHPGMYIDNCASGGRRIDLESLDRSVPMSRSDYCCVPTIDPMGGQIHNYGLMHWVPLNATINYTKPGYTYGFRSDMSAGVQFSLFDSHGTEKDGMSHVPEGYPYDWHKKMMSEYKKARPYFYGDYYPLTDITTSDKDWTAYQLNRPDLKEGMVMVFKRIKSKDIQEQFKLKGLDEKAAYQFENADSDKTLTIDGKKLMSKGFTINIENAPECRLWFYKKLN
jgi:alpha-galactosidase